MVLYSKHCASERWGSFYAVKYIVYPIFFTEKSKLRILQCFLNCLQVHKILSKWHTFFEFGASINSSSKRYLIFQCLLKSSPTNLLQFWNKPLTLFEKYLLGSIIEARSPRVICFRIFLDNRSAFRLATLTKYCDPFHMDTWKSSVQRDSIWVILLYLPISLWIFFIQCVQDFVLLREHCMSQHGTTS